MNFQREYLSSFPDKSERDKHLYKLCREYIRRTDDYDKTVCSAPKGMPANVEESRLINKNAKETWAFLFSQYTGYSWKDKEIIDCLNSIRQYQYDNRRSL